MDVGQLAGAPARPPLDGQHHQVKRVDRLDLQPAGAAAARLVRRRRRLRHHTLVTGGQRHVQEPLGGAGIGGGEPSTRWVAGTIASKAAKRSLAGRSSRSTPSRCSRSKKKRTTAARREPPRCRRCDSSRPDPPPARTAMRSHGPQRRRRRRRPAAAARFPPPASNATSFDLALLRCLTAGCHLFCLTTRFQSFGNTSQSSVCSKLQSSATGMWTLMLVPVVDALHSLRPVQGGRRPPRSQTQLAVAALHHALATESAYIRRGIPP